MVDQFIYIITGTGIPNGCRVQSGFQCFQKIITVLTTTGGDQVSASLGVSLFVVVIEV